MIYISEVFFFFFVVIVSKEMSNKIEKPSKKSIVLNLNNGKNILINKQSTSTSLISTREMKIRIEQNLLKALFFRPNLITSIKVFLPNIIPIENIPRFFQNNVFFNYLDKNNIKIVIDADIARAYNKQTNNLICACILEKEDIIHKILRFEPNLETEELKTLEQNLNKSYHEYVMTNLEEKNEQNIPTA